MKRITAFTSLLLGGLLLSAGSTTGMAANENEAATNGTVQFKQQAGDSEGGVTKPGTEEDIIEPETGGHTVGPLRLTHVPDFDFDQMEIASETRFGNALLEKYRDKGAAEVKNISHFVQVEDVRGLKSGWTLTVSATKFMPSNTSNVPLSKSHIVLQQGILKNTRMTDAEISGKVSGFVKGMAITNDRQAVSILGTKPGENTDSSKTSLVFNDSYTKDQTDAGSVTIGTGANTKLFNPGVQLQAVGTDEKVKDENYTTTLTWTIEDAK